MLPNNELSTISYAAEFLGDRKTPPRNGLEDKETTNVAVSQFIFAPLNWSGSSDGTTIVLTPETGSSITPVTDINITEFSFTFDQNQRPIVAYVANGNAKLHWYDAVASAMVTTDFGSTFISPRVSLDDKHRLGNDTNDVIFAYIRNDNLCTRIQRERYQIEKIQGVVPTGTRLRRIGMNAGNRFQFEFFTAFGSIQE